jgi:hypothetical protein
MYITKDEKKKKGVAFMTLFLLFLDNFGSFECEEMCKHQLTEWDKEAGH